MNNYQNSCSEDLFQSKTPPVLPYGMDDLNELAEVLVKSRTAVPGVQKKLSLHLTEVSGIKKLTFIGLWGDYILKPPVEAYPQLPENEFLTMCLADEINIKTVPHGLIRMKSGEPAYITRRIDRAGSAKIHMEDMCQLSGKMTEDKYRGSLEKIGKLINRYCDDRLYDVLRFFEVVLFSFVTGNGDMHLKNFSLTEAENKIFLSPAYDLINTRLVIPEKDDPEESALSLNGKRSRLVISDFVKFGTNLGLNEIQIRNTFRRFLKAENKFIELIFKSMLTGEKQESYAGIVKTRFRVIKSYFK